ncbi:MAG: murein transglycosylase A [Geminicoccaceae bacterium]|nr:murein transglycosylase A [Geminicoccaceae bacterium]
MSRNLPISGRSNAIPAVPTPTGPLSRPALPDARVSAVSRSIMAAAVALLLASCSETREPEPTSPTLVPVSFGSIDGWKADDQWPALAAFRRSCGRIGKADGSRDWGIAGKVSAWQAICADLQYSQDARTFFENHFQAYEVHWGDEDTGLFTGYYEPLLHGSRQPDEHFNVPLHARPQDLVSVDLGRFSDEMKGRRIGGRVVNGKLEPYADRAAIDAGAIDDVARPLLWVDDPIAKFFLQIQGSGQVRLTDGSVVRVGYADQNGRPYRAIGRDLIDMGALTRENVSLQSIRDWLEAHPDQANDIMHRNASYVFFRELDDLAGESGPLGAGNVPLEPGRSLAVDRKFWSMGMPVWLDTTAPYPDGERPFRRLMIAQDTGGAIRGAIRGDVFWGAGDLAEYAAGHMKGRGRMLVLLPKSSAPSS